MMKNFKKSEIVVYVVALMLVTAGYFNYTANYDKTSLETYSEDVEKLTEEANGNVGDAVLVNSNEVVSSNDGEGNDEEAENSNQTGENNTWENAVESSISLDTSNTTSQSVQTNSDVDQNNYFASSKLERETMYANMISSYQNVLNNSNVSEAQKNIAAQEITKINNTKNSIMICENLILTKGFDNCVIFINEGSVNVVVSIKDGLSADKVAQVQNIISREIGTEIEGIHIMEK